MKIRFATFTDIEALIELGAQMHGEGDYAFLPYDREKVFLLLAKYLSDSERYCVFVAEADDRLVGVLCGYVSSYFFCDEIIACDTAVFVAPKYRNGRAAIGIINAFRDWSSARGAREICLAVSSNVHTDRTARLYEHLGLHKVGGVFKQRLGEGEA